MEMILFQTNIDKKTYAAFRANIERHSRIALHFHPDRLISNKKTVAEGLIEDGYYKNQFETKISSGSTTAFSGGQRDDWENHIFKNIYQNASPSERPKYGALNLTLTEDGPSPRFGSCYFLLAPQVSQRSTFSYGDTHQSPDELGTLSNFELIISALLYDLSVRQSAVGIFNIDLLSFMKLVNDLLPMSADVSKYRPFSKNLDFYIEAQVHGPISLQDDVDQLVVDYSFKNTKTGADLETLCEKYDIKINWNSGVQLHAQDFPGNFRGPEIPGFANFAAKHGIVNANIIGEASRKIQSTNEHLQKLKYLWHCLVKFANEIRAKVVELE